MSLIHIFAATPLEAKPIVRMIVPNLPGSNSRLRRAGKIGPNAVELFVCGTGPQAAHACARQAIEGGGSKHRSRPDAVLVTGLCGALSPRFAEGTLVLYTECLSSVEKGEKLSPSFAAQFMARLAARGISCAEAVGITSPRIAASKAEKLSLAASGAEVVDMESYPILQVATASAIPCGVLRVVSDSLDRRLPDFNPALQTDGRISRLAATRIVLRSPLRTAHLVLASRRAMQQLSAALTAIFTGLAEFDLPSISGRASGVCCS